MANWKSKLNLRGAFYNDAMTFDQRRDEVVRRIRAAEWFRTAVADEDDGYEIKDIVDDLADSKDAAAFDEVWANFYDWADTDHRLWIDLQ